MIASTLVVTCLTAVLAQTPDTAEVLRRAQASAARMQHFSATVSVSVESSQGGSPIGDPVPSYPSDWIRDGEQFKSVTWSQVPVAGQPGAVLPAYIEMASPTQYWLLHTIFGTKDPVPPIQAAVARNLEGRTAKYNAGLNGAQCLDGVLHGDTEDVFTILLRHLGQVSMKNEYLDGYACIRLSAKLPDSAYEVWVDPELGYLARKSIVEKTIPLGTRPFTHVHLWAHFVATVDRVEFETINGIFVPVAGRMIVEGQPAAISSILKDREDWTFRREKLILGARMSSADFRIELPDGATVQDLDTSREYVMTSGQLVSVEEPKTALETNAIVYVPR